MEKPKIGTSGKGLIPLRALTETGIFYTDGYTDGHTDGRTDRY